MNEKNKNEVVAISDSAHWVDIKTVAEIKNITSRAIRLSFSRGKYTYRETTGHGGKSYEILLSSLDEKTQEIYKNTYYREIIETVNHELLIPITKPVEKDGGEVFPVRLKKSETSF